MIELIWIALIIGGAYLLFVWVPAYFRKRKERSEKEILDLSFNEGPTIQPKSVQRVWILRGMIAVAVILFIAALASRNIDLFYVILVWIVPMLVVNNFQRIMRWMRDFIK
jgi:hypothetical protein